MRDDVTQEQILEAEQFFEENGYFATPGATQRLAELIDRAERRGQDTGA